MPVPGRRAGRVLDGQLGNSCQFPEAREVALLRNKRVLLVYMDATEERCCTGLEEYPSVTRVTPPARLLHRCALIAIQVQGEFETFRLLAQQRQNG